jgi:hypothetical protein
MKMGIWTRFRMKNFKYSIIASIILSIALIACGGDNGTSPSDVIPDSVPGSPLNPSAFAGGFFCSIEFKFCFLDFKNF